MLNSMALPRMSWMFLSCLMLLSQVQGQDVEEDVPSSRISCPKGSRAYGSYCYALFRIAKSWFDADGQEPNGGGWEWSNADVMNFFNWEISPSSSSGGYCGSLSRNSGYLKWRDNYCDMELAYVCKFTA
ncbi:regenerating islet-derived protein 3-gamma-like isoform X2 [Cricetulus griseus]|uniref:Regenerating islet-derived protein 3-gamma-like isoform X2 n=1 Tax=Cricetulus griseus TaxID=10029 RepID=A0A9J7H629_CRIGR|nr:regenerating islet-derived protein 3-gamma-like isoform X2 [Cricetulus griseus]XP_035313071.1 regenerating islet-derived protein 3-gamma-like isoform X2 [Cricetulus griseus]